MFKSGGLYYKLKDEDLERIEKIKEKRFNKESAIQQLNDDSIM